MHIRTAVLTLFLLSSAAAAHAQVCVKVDEPNDTLGPDDRAAAVLLLTREFKLAGQPVAADCPQPYLVAHIKLGETITVLLTGPAGQREGKALGLDDLPALYNQMVRSLITGELMNSAAVVDRTNVTAAQATANRIGSDGFTYARLGYAGIFAGDAYGVPSFGFGYRAELDRVAIDVSLFNVQAADNAYVSSRASVGNASFVKLSGLYLLDSTGSATPYFGGGLSYGRSYVNGPYQTPVPRTPDAVYYYTAGGAASGLQAELTAGYEIGRATNLRMFVQVDATLPFYSVTSNTYSNRGALVSSDRHYTPSVTMSIGLGWGRNRSRR